MDYKLEPATIDNLDLLIKYKLKNVFAYTQDLKQEEIDRINKYVKANVPRKIKNYKLIMNNDKIIGCINKKIGTSLIKNIQTKYSPVYLWVYKQNTRAYNLYKHLGFEIQEETETRYFMKYLNNQS